MLIAREFTKEDKDKLLEMVNEINELDGNFEGLNNIKNIDDFDEFLEKLERNKHQELISIKLSPQTTYGVFEDGKLIGGFNLRNILKGNLLNHGGHIGYLIRPSKRNKGYGTKLLKLALEKAKESNIDKVLVTCRKENIASARVIEKNKGIYENDYYDEETNQIYKRYWINVR